MVVVSKVEHAYIGLIAVHDPRHTQVTAHVGQCKSGKQYDCVPSCNKAMRNHSFLLSVFSRAFHVEKRDCCSSSQPMYVSSAAMWSVL